MAKGGKGGGGLGDFVKAESMVQVAIALPVGCLVGWLLGEWLDKHFHQHWMALAGILLGAAGGFVSLIRTAMGLMKDGK